MRQLWGMFSYEKHPMVPFSCYCTSYWTGMCVFLATFSYERENFVMIITGSISVQSCILSPFAGLFLGARLPQQISRLLEEEMGERATSV